MDEAQLTPSPIRASLVELTGLLLSTDSFDALMQQVATLAARTVVGATSCGITLADNGRIFTAGASDELANQLDEVQYEGDAGPCLEALDTGQVVHGDDYRDEKRWNGYPVRAMSYGIMAGLSMPLLVTGKPVGALNLYASAPHAFDAADRQLAELVAGQATLALTAALRRFDEQSLTENLRSALASRSVIDQAIGIVIAQRHCTPEAAFDILRTVSQHRNIKLREVARQLVNALSNPGADSQPTG